MIKVHPKNKALASKTFNGSHPLIYIDGKVIGQSITKVKVEYDNSVKASEFSYAVPPPDRFITYEQSDMDWLIFFGMAPKTERQLYYESNGMAMTAMGRIEPLNFEKKYFDENCLY